MAMKEASMNARVVRKEEARSQMSMRHKELFVKTIFVAVETPLRWLAPNCGWKAVPAGSGMKAARLAAASREVPRAAMRYASGSG